MLLYCTIELSDKNKQQIESEILYLFDDHPEYMWYPAINYRINLYSWTNVESDLYEKLKEKMESLLFEMQSFQLYSQEYVVKIGSRIDIFLNFQEGKQYRKLGETINNFFSPQIKFDHIPHIGLARYKIPSKQQYSHLKNQLEKLDTNVEIAVQSVNLAKVTDFGNGDKKYDIIDSIKF